MMHRPTTTFQVIHGESGEDCNFRDDGTKRAAIEESETPKQNDGVWGLRIYFNRVEVIAEDKERGLVSFIVSF